MAHGLRVMVNNLHLSNAVFRVWVEGTLVDWPPVMGLEMVVLTCSWAGDSPLFHLKIDDAVGLRSVAASTHRGYRDHI